MAACAWLVQYEQPGSWRAAVTERGRAPGRPGPRGDSVRQTAGRSTSAFRGIQLSRPLWPHQQRALDAFEKDRKRGDRSTYLVVPPGGGKTLIGLEALRRLGRPALVLCPNTAIQAQWI